MRRRFLKCRNNNKIIIYTSSDNLIVTPYKYGFGATIIKNTINNNVGIITFDRDVTSIGYEAFAHCSNLTSIQIPDSVISIGDYAFDYCSSLVSVEIPDSVTSIGDFAFNYCSSLASIVVDIGNSIYDSRNGCNAIIETDSNTLVVGCKNTIIPNSVTSIGRWAFQGRTNLTSIQIPNNVTSIEAGAFNYCSSLVSVVIGNGVTSFNGNVFSGCVGLTNITVDADNIKYDSRNGCNAIIETASNTLIIGCKNTIIPNSVTSIRYSAFESCASLTSIEIPNSVTSIGDVAFRECSSLTSVTMGNSITEIGDSAFGRCSNLASIEIPNGVAYIGDNAFERCSSLTSIEIPNGVTYIGSDAFWYCSKLTSVYVKATRPPTLGYDAFEYNASSRKIYVPIASANAYKTASRWSDYASAIVPYDY